MTAMLLSTRRKRYIFKVLVLITLTWLILLYLMESNSRTTEKPTQSSDTKDSRKEERRVLLAPRDPDGPGEMGKPVILATLTKEQEELKKLGYKNFAFNEYASNMISLHRSLPDVRDSECRDIRYPQKLPRTSVIICFHNEAWSILLRTVHSVLSRTPKEYLSEILLVDDFSSMKHLKKRLDDYVKHLPKVKVLRAPERLGLIRARMLGASRAKGPVLTFLDSHCECTDGWVEPLLARIEENYTHVVCPVIDDISQDTLQYSYDTASKISIGGFDWGLQFDWHEIPRREVERRKHPWLPVHSPTMAGGLFSIHKQYFEKLGKYDEEFDIWGGENLELSFKIWMCGGTLEIIPCSHVGHIFRERSPYQWRPGVNVLKKNLVRLALVWMDEYAQFYFQRLGKESLGEYGDLTSRKKLRNDLKCKSFKWYLDTIYPEMFIPSDAIASGEVRNLNTDSEGNNMCLDSMDENTYKPLGLYPCHEQGGNQYWFLTNSGEIRRDNNCMDNAGSEVYIYPCHGSGGNQFWIYNHEEQIIKQGFGNDCLSLYKKKLVVLPCNGGIEQRWKFENYDPSKLTRRTGIEES